MAGPWMSSVAATRMYAILSGLFVRRSRPPNSGLVRPWLVLAGLHWSRPASLLIGIWTFATAELYGPTTPMTAGSFTNVCMSCAPCCSLYLPLTAWSSGGELDLVAAEPPLALASSTASCAPLRVGCAVGGRAARERERDAELERLARSQVPPEQPAATTMTVPSASCAQSRVAS